MFRDMLKYAAVIMAAVLVMSVAVYLDKHPAHPESRDGSGIQSETALSNTLSTEAWETGVWETEAWERSDWEMTEPATQPEETTIPEETEADNRFLLTFAGDCTLGSNPVNRFALYGFENTVADNYRYPFANVIGYFESDDFTMVNLEGTLGDKGTAAIKNHVFRGSAEYVNILTENSVEAVTLANNHSMDYGPKGYEATKQILEDGDVPYVEDGVTQIFTTENGLTIGVYATVYYNLNVDHMVTGIKELKDQGVDLIIFAAHWGAEGYYKPNEIQMNAGHAAIDAGAQIVYGCHPHVLQPIKKYNGGIIYYSLGNFSFGGNLYPEDYDTALVQQEVIRNADGTVSLGELTVVPCRLSSVTDHNNFQPTPYAEDTEDYARVMKKLGLDS